MKSANINQAVTGFGMALAAMGASQADAEIVSLSFGNSPFSVACNSDCAKQGDVNVYWGASSSIKIKVNFSAFASDGLYVYESLAARDSAAMLAFRNLGASISASAVSTTTVQFSRVVGNRFLAFNTTDDLNGWIKVNFAGSLAATRTVTFIEGAIETTAGTAITVGDVPLAPVPVPPMLPAMGLAVLALGAAGVRRARKAA